LSNLIF
jgi:hypothetical protein